MNINHNHVDTNFQMEFQSNANFSDVGIFETGERNCIVNEFEAFISRQILTTKQNELTYRLVGELSKINEPVDINFEKTQEDNEILFVYKNSRSINFVSIDEDGDIMISISPFNEQVNGERIFIDSEQFDEEYIVYKLLS